VQNCAISNYLKSYFVNPISTAENLPIPDDITLAWAPIEQNEESGIPFVDPEVLKAKPSQKRLNEYLSSRKLLGKMLINQGIEAAKFTLRKKELGKPFGSMNGQEVHLSFSHSPSWVFCGLSETREIGVDCEPIDREAKMDILRRILDDSEREVLKEESLLSIWTMKEAVVKCLGTGIRTSLKKYQLQKSGDLFEVNTENGSIFVTPFIWKDHQMAVAWRV